MAYNLENLARLKDLKSLSNRINTDFATKAALKTVSDKVDTLENAGGQPNVLEGVKVNGTALAIAEKMVDILIATGTANGTIKVNGVDISITGLAAMAYKANVSEADLDSALTTIIANKANSADVYNKEQIDAKISAVYKPAGSVAFADLPTATEANLGNVYNVTGAFTTTDAFLEGAGKNYPAGTNVVVISAGEGAYGYDALTGFIDLSGYVQKEDGKGLSTNDYTTAEKAKLAGIAEDATKVEASATAGYIKINGTETKVVGIATDDEVTEMLNEVFGTPEETA